MSDLLSNVTPHPAELFVVAKALSGFAERTGAFLQAGDVPETVALAAVEQYNRLLDGGLGRLTADMSALANTLLTPLPSDAGLHQVNLAAATLAAVLDAMSDIPAFMANQAIAGAAISKAVAEAGVGDHQLELAPIGVGTYL